MIKNLSIIFFILFSFHLSASCQNDKKDEILIVGENNFPPFSYIDTDGKYKGFSIDLTKEIMRRLDCPYRIKLTNWESAIDSLDSHKAELIINLAYSEQRDSIYHFSSAYSYAKFNLVSYKNSSLKFISDLKGKRIVVQRNSIGESLLKASSSQCEIIYSSTAKDALQMLKNGEADGCVINTEVAEFYIHALNLNTIEVKQLSFGTLDNCFASYGGKRTFIRKIDKVLIEMIDDGTYDKIYQKWLISTPFSFWENYGFAISFICGIIIFILVIWVVYYFYRLRYLLVSLKKSNQRLINSNSLLNQIIQKIPMGVYIKDADNDFRYLIVNDKLKAFYAHSTNDSVGKNDSELFQDSRASMFYKEDLEVLNGNGKTFQYIKSEIHNNRVYIYSTHSTLLSTPTGRKFIIGLVDDITDNEELKKNLQREKEKAEESDKLKSAFLANMSHEIRTPLNAIVGFSDLMEEDVSPQEKSEFIKIIHVNSDLLLNIINDILDLSKIEAGMLEFKYEEFNLSEYFNELTSSFKRTMCKPGVELIVMNPDEKCTMNYDKKRYAQVLTNFVSNAFKYTQNGYIRIGYECTDTEIRTYVEDTGIGIDDEKQKKLFHRFEKLDSFAQGTGLGLAISKAIVEHNGGKIGFSSEKDKGSLFWFSIKR